ncbi:MAG: hypothetical protein ACRC8D_07245 [Aeromonas sp.]
MPAHVPVTATNIETGEVLEFKTIMDAVKRGGFDYTCVRKCVHGRQGQHAGYTWKAAEPLRGSGIVTRAHLVADRLKAGLTTQEIAQEMGLTHHYIKCQKYQAEGMGLLG